MKSPLLLFIPCLLLAISACNKNDLFPNSENLESMEHDGVTRHYAIHVPPSYDGSSAMPVVLNFHGFGGDASLFMAEGSLRSVADLEGFILVCPQGTLLDGVSHWNAALDSPTNKSDADDLGFVEALIDELADNYSIDASKIYTCGYSNGGMMSMALACYKRDLIAAAASVSGAMLDTTCTTSSPIPIISFHGTSDNVLPYNGNADYNSVQSILNYWTRFNQTDSLPEITNLTSSGQSVEFQSYNNGSDQSAVHHYKVINGQHIWFSLSLNGNSMEQTIWNFFEEYPK